MLEITLVPEHTVITAKGDGQAADISAAQQRVLLLTLNVTRTVEQESLDLSVWASPDGADWGQKAIASFPQLFYAGEHPLLLDLTAQPGLRFLRAHWEVNRWGRGSETPMFEVSLVAREIPAEMLRDATPAHARA